MLAVGAVIYAVLLLLFLLLYPGAQRKNAAVMQSLGSGYLARWWHVFLSAMAVVLLASTLGGWIGELLWDHLVAALQASTESTIALQIQPGALRAVALVQLLLAAMLTLLTAAFVAAPRKMASRR